MITFDECMRRRLLRRMAPSPRQAQAQLGKAQALLEEAEGAVEDERPNLAIIGGYAAMFSAARALLFRDGYQEKSHACVARYLEAKYPDQIDQAYIDLLDQYRTRRHKVMYGADYYPTMREAGEIVSFAGKLMDAILGIMGDRERT